MQRATRSTQRPKLVKWNGKKSSVDGDIRGGNSKETGRHSINPEKPRGYFVYP